LGHSFTSSLFHCVFSTKGRRLLITEDLQSRLWPYIGGIARDNRMKALTIGGVEDHVHILLSLPSTMAIAKAIQLMKGESSLWVHENLPENRNFAWQEGYGAFSLDIALVERTACYINSQKEHHRKQTFQDEFLAFLKRHNMEFDERYIWD
jgi:REP element-mobilizing transposase RayT